MRCERTVGMRSTDSALLSKCRLRQAHAHAPLRIAALRLTVAAPAPRWRIISIHARTSSTLMQCAFRWP